MSCEWQIREVQVAARAYDLAALACKGRNVATNFPAGEYAAELNSLHACTKVPGCSSAHTWL